MKTNHSHSGCRQVLALLLTVLTVMSMLPSAAFAAQPTTYRDPAEHWMNAGSRTNELDINAVVSHETFYCHSCKQYTSFTIWRTPEYTRDGQTALTRNVLYSDGTMVDGEGTGSILDGDPGIDAFYTGYHWTKSMCDNCGVMNANGGTSHYGYSKNVYNLYDCASGFSEDLKDDVTYEYADDTYHTKTVEGGHYCEFCFGTVHTHSSTLERHNLKTEVKAQLDKQRFAVVTSCADCDYTKTEYVAAKSVVADYYGAVDGQAHTLTVSDLSESGVTAKIRYGNSADACTLVTPPSYTEEGQYTVYYAVTYTYKNVSMTENGVAYVWLHDESVKEPEHPNPAHDPSISVDSTEHNYVYLDTVAPTCSTLGYDRYLCSICGAVDKRNYQNATGHAIQSILIREADCEHEGKTLEICRSCGEVKETLTPKGEHQVKTYKVSATCTAPGYTVRECDICGDRQITDITAVKGHSFVANVVAPTCTTGGHTQHICKDCGESYFDSYTQATGHDWDDGTVIKDPTCNNAGVIEYRCKVCDATKLEDYNGDGDDHDHGSVSVTPVVNTTVKSGTGHRYTSAVTAPTCTEMGFTTYTCVDCGDTYKADYVDATGHTYKAVVTKPTCTKMGYTTYTCKDCGNSYKSDYTELLGHDYTAVVTAPTCTEGGYTAYTCTRCGDSYVDDVTEALGHDWKAPVILADSTCNSDGVKEYDCSRCDAHYHEAISAKGHNPGPDATCLNPQTCKDCGAVLAPATGHQYTKKVTKPACTKMGYTTYTCDRCGDSYKSDYTELLGHDYVAKVTDPTCTEGGYTTFTCSRCGDSYVTDYTDPTGHDWDAGTKITDATCNGEGVLEHHCKSCDETYLEAVSAKGHNPGSKATCTEDQICRDCGAVIEKAHGHDFAATVTAPTCTELGFTTYACKNCDKTYISDYVKSTGHKESNWIVDRKPTTEAEGSRHKECVTCHEKLVTEPIAKLYLYATTDSRGEATVGEYLVIVTDTSSGKPITNAAVELNKDGTISVRFPDGRLLDYGNHTTVYVLKSEDKSPVKGVQIYVTDVKGNYVPDVTDKNGQITIPDESGDTGDKGSITFGGKDADNDPYTVTVNVVDGRNNRPIDGAEVSIGKTGTITVVLPDGLDMDEKNPIVITVTDQKGRPLDNVTVIVKGDKDKETGKTGEDGTLTLPEVTVIEKHGAYIYGYPDGTFGPSRSMTRSEAAAIFARLLAERKGDTIPETARTKFTDIPANAWYSGYVKYLTGYGIVTGSGDNKFSPNAEITRAEVVAMAVRFFEVYDGGNAAIMEQYAEFNDVSEGYWAAEYIKDAAIHGWIKGYGDGTFRATANITRAEAVTIINRLLGRVADEDYIDANLRKLTTFTDMTTKHWAYYEVMESANAHTADVTKGESWMK